MHRAHQHGDGNRDQGADEAADEARHEAEQRPFRGLERRMRVLLAQVNREHASAEDPQATTAVAHVDDRQRRQNADEDTTEERGLQFA